MRHIITLFLLPILLLVSSMDAYAQLQLGNAPSLPAPEAAGITQAGNHSVNLYTGRVTVSIPIYTYSDTDFNIPVSLEYNYNGMRPNEQPSAVGLGWFLNCGGAITREVKGFPDEEGGSIVVTTYLSPYEDTVYPFDSIPFSSSFSPTTIDYGALGVNESPLTSFKVAQGYGGYKYDYSSDVYHFSFLGHQGSFIRNTDGTFNVFGTSDAKENYRIEKYTQSYGDGTSASYSEFTITTGDGYKYYFGSQSEKNLYNDRVGSAEKEAEANSITSWKLRKITAPSGREIAFVYGSHDEPQDIQCYRADYWYMYSTSPASVNSAILHSTCCAALEGITVDGTTVISFENDYRPVSRKAQYLQSSIVKEMDESNSPVILKSIHFADAEARLVHSYNLWGNPYPFLTEVHIEGIGSYKMEYNNGEDCYFPPFGTTSTDHWGYQKGNSPTTCNVSSVNWTSISTLGARYSETLGTAKSPDTSASENGLMTKIKYPTGGWTSFEYQPNDYSRCIDKRLSSSYSPAEYLESGTGPGHRIYRIQHYDSNGTLSDSREYRYRKNEGSSTSSGRLLASPRYRVNYSGRVGNTQEYLYYGTLGGLYPTGSVLLEYPRVEEIRGDGSRIVYTFTSWDDIPDIYNHDFNDIARCVNQGPGYNAGVMGGISEKELLNRLLEPASDLQSERGQPLTVSYYVSGETVPVKTEETIYDFLPALPFVSWYANAGDARAEVRIFIDRHQVTGMTVNDRYSSGTVSLDNIYSYNSGGQRISETHTDSNGHKHKIEYQYISDIDPSSRTAVQQAMVSAGYTSFPVKTTRSVKPRGTSNWQIEEETLHVYAAYTNAGGDTFYNLASIQKKDLDVSQYRTLYSFKFGPQGQMIERTDADGHSTSYAWSADGNGVAIIIENADNQTVCQVSGMGNLFSIDLTPANTETMASSLRSALTQSRVTSILYYSPGHPSQITDASGQQKTYTYDKANRVLSISETGTGLLESYLYNTKTR